jgi:rubrerythrin
MNTFYSAPEVIEMAIKTEETGQIFYTNTAKKTKSKPLAELFKFLAGEEEKHKKTFSGLYKTIKENPQTIPFNWEEVSQYLKAITDSKFFLGSNKAMASISKVKTPKTLLDFAIAFEKETMLFYIEIANFIKEKDKPLVNKIVVQEKEHIRKLSMLKETV